MAGSNSPMDSQEITEVAHKWRLEGQLKGGPDSPTDEPVTDLRSWPREHRLDTTAMMVQVRRLRARDAAGTEVFARVGTRATKDLFTRARSFLYAQESRLRGPIRPALRSLVEVEKSGQVSEPRRMLTMFAIMSSASPQTMSDLTETIVAETGVSSEQLPGMQRYIEAGVADVVAHAYTSPNTQVRDHWYLDNDSSGAPTIRFEDFIAKPPDEQ